MDYILKNNIKIEIREAKSKDAMMMLDFFYLVNSETKNLSREPHEVKMTLEDEVAFIENCFKSNNQIMIIVVYKNRVIASSSFMGTRLARMNHRVSMGTSVLNEFHNLGIGSLMMETLISKAKEYNKRKIELEVRSDNYGAIHLYEKYGFKLEGVRKNGFYVEDKYVDLTLMGLELEEKL